MLHTSLLHLVGIEGNVHKKAPYTRAAGGAQGSIKIPIEKKSPVENTFSTMNRVIGLRYYKNVCGNRQNSTLNSEQIQEGLTLKRTFTKRSYNTD